MALQLGTENKRQVYMLAALLVVIVLIGGYELKQYFISPTAPARPAAATVPASAKPAAGRETAATQAASEGKEAQKLTNAGIDPALHLDRLAFTESVEYAGTGRNIFSVESAPAGLARIETPVAGARPGHPVVKMPPPPPEKPRPPAIDLKYFGYTQARDKSLQAFFCSRGRCFHRPERRDCEPPLQGRDHSAGQCASDRLELQQHAKPAFDGELESSY